MIEGIVLAASIFAQPGSPPPKPYQQQPWNFQHYDARARERGAEPESMLDRERREYQARHPEVWHCRLPACSTK